MQNAEVSEDNTKGTAINGGGMVVSEGIWEQEGDDIFDTVLQFKGGSLGEYDAIGIACLDENEVLKWNFGV